MTPQQEKALQEAKDTVAKRYEDHNQVTFMNWEHFAGHYKGGVKIQDNILAEIAQEYHSILSSNSSTDEQDAIEKLAVDIENFYFSGGRSSGHNEKILVSMISKALGHQSFRRFSLDDIRDFAYKIGGRYGVHLDKYFDKNVEELLESLTPSSHSEVKEKEFKVERLKNGMGYSHLLVIVEDAIEDIYIGGVVIVPYAEGFKDPIKVLLQIDEKGLPKRVNEKFAIVLKYIYE